MMEPTYGQDVEWKSALGTVFESSHAHRHALTSGMAYNLVHKLPKPENLFHIQDTSDS